MSMNHPPEIIKCLSNFVKKSKYYFMRFCVSLTHKITTIRVTIQFLLIEEEDYLMNTQNMNHTLSNHAHFGISGGWRR